MQIQKHIEILEPYHRSNQDTCLVHKPAVQVGEWVESGDLLADNSASMNGELAIGQNILVAYMPWEGFNYEDAILINERLVYDDIYTSIHIERYEIETKESKLGGEQITRNIPDLKPEATAHLDKHGIATVGSWIEEGDILVGKVTPINPKSQTPYQRLLFKLLDKKVNSVRDSSLRAPKGMKANIIQIQVLSAQKAEPTKGTKKNIKNLSKIGSNLKSRTNLLQVNINLEKELKKSKIQATGAMHRKAFFSFFKKKAKKRLQNIYLPCFGFLNNILSKQSLESRTEFDRVSPSKNTVKLPKIYVKKFLKNAFVEKQSKKTVAFPLTAEKQKTNYSIFKYLLNRKNKTNPTSAPGLLRLSPDKSKTAFSSLPVYSLEFLNTNNLQETKVPTYQKKKHFVRKDKSFVINTIFKSLQTNSLPNLTLLSGFTPENKVKNKNKEYYGLKAKTSFFYSKKSTVTQKKMPLLSVWHKLGQNKSNRFQINQTTAFFTSKKRPQNIIPTSIHLYLAEKRKIQVGDKMAGRHGNKGILSNILPRQDMPYLPDGTAIDIVLNPLGVPSRMNVGQIYECLLGLAGKYLGEHYKVFPFDEIYGAEASRSFVFSKLFEARLKTGIEWLFDANSPGKIRIFDGRTGECFDQPVTVGIAYMLKLVHMVDDKMHMRSSGPYSLVTQQPLRGRAKQGGQRLGEMEVWAIEGYGAAFVLLEMLTLKSDDMTGRLTLWSNLVLNKEITIGTPESFKVLVCELQALCLDIGLYTRANSSTNLNTNIQTSQNQFKEISHLMLLP